MQFLHSKSKKLAAVISYFYLGLNALISIFLTPIILNYLGVNEYGLYQMVYSVGHYILILDLGIGMVMIRYISEYRAKNDRKGEENFSAMIGIITIVLSIIVFIIGIIVDANIENIFTRLTVDEYAKSHTMFYLMILQFIFTIVDHYFQGIICAYEHFSFTKIIGICKLIFVFFSTILFLKLGWGAVGIVAANTVACCIFTIIDMLYTFKTLKVRICYYHWDKIILKPAIGLMLAMLLQSVVGHVNSSVDKTILGVMCTQADVTVYSVAATVITLFNTIPTVISGLFQPQVTRMVVHKASNKELTDLVIRVGRWQFLLCGAFLAGMILFGIHFLQLWIGAKLTDEQIIFCWIIMLIILPFNMIPLIQTVCISILNAYDKRMDRSLILTGMCVVNILASILFVNTFGPIGCPLGTALSYLIGYAFILNIYYNKKLKLDVVRMFKEIFRRTWLCLLVTTLITLLLLFISYNSLFFIILTIVFFVFSLCFFMYKYGFNGEEKDICLQLVKKLHLK